MLHMCATRIKEQFLFKETTLQPPRKVLGGLSAVFI